MAERLERVFKTAWFAKASKKAYITDDELCSAIRQVMHGQADDLGGGVFKKRLSKNQYRSVILAKGAPVLGLRVPFCQAGPGKH